MGRSDGQRDRDTDTDRRRDRQTDRHRDQKRDRQMSGLNDRLKRHSPKGLRWSIYKTPQKLKGSFGTRNKKDRLRNGQTDKDKKTDIKTDR